MQATLYPGRPITYNGATRGSVQYPAERSQVRTCRLRCRFTLQAQVQAPMHAAPDARRSEPYVVFTNQSYVPPPYSGPGPAWQSAPGYGAAPQPSPMPFIRPSFVETSREILARAMRHLHAPPSSAHLPGPMPAGMLPAPRPTAAAPQPQVGASVPPRSPLVAGPGSLPPGFGPAPPSPAQSALQTSTLSQPAPTTATPAEARSMPEPTTVNLPLLMAPTAAYVPGLEDGEAPVYVVNHVTGRHVRVRMDGVVDGNGGRTKHALFGLRSRGHLVQLRCEACMHCTVRWMTLMLMGAGTWSGVAGWACWRGAWWWELNQPSQYTAKTPACACSAMQHSGWLAIPSHPIPSLSGTWRSARAARLHCRARRRGTRTMRSSVSWLPSDADTCNTRYAPVHPCQQPVLLRWMWCCWLRLMRLLGWQGR